MGGNAPLMAEALLKLGVSVDFIGTIGDPIFQPFIQKCRHAFSLSASGESDALEFEDGKIILGKHAAILGVNDETLQKTVGSSLKKLYDEADLIAMVNWTMLPGMNSIWRYIQKECGKSGKLFFFDLADPFKRPPEDLREAIELIASFDRAILGLNEAEAAQVEALFGSLETLGIAEVVVHSKTRATVYADGSRWSYDNPLIINPVTTTGAGDNFNAGYCFARLSCLDYPQSLEKACLVARSYITK